ncbi:MAG: DUF1778 domain-containing protein [Planctomycetes bacterium]|nr:DUF1778 domain-containing protein [Planctomycetota bacterium]MBL7038837.1 DUF1778 domain-containing protein [Pirellulaceae bacterium]
MTAKETSVVDAEARVALPTRFANAAVIVEELSVDEVRIRKANAVPDNEAQFPEERITTLSDRDRDRFIELLENPPEANAALRKAMAEHRKQHD